MTLIHIIPHRVFELVTHLGDSALLIPFSIAIVAGLLWQNRASTAFRFGAVVAADAVLTLISKLSFYAGGGSPDLNILTPSGHSSLSITVYGCLAVILASRRPFAQQALILGAATVGLVAISISRIVLGMHTPQEVLFGTLVGGLCVAVFSLGSAHLPRVRLQLPIRLLVVLAIGSVSVWAIGHRLNTEGMIGRVGTEIGSVLRSS
jgi:membrane-associated phospholipid phosphatase